jgi:Uma2 family endonuclease
MLGTMGRPAKRNASYDDVLAAPETVVAELIDGELYLTPRPAKPHALAASVLGEELGPPFRRGKGGPGGWILLDEPEIHFGADVLVPDLAGWRRERMPAVVADEAHFTVAPDWVCEVLSPSTEQRDRAQKLAIYARGGVRHAWLVDPLQRTLEVLRLQGDKWLLLHVEREDAAVRAEPFDAIALELGALWADLVVPAGAR